MTSKATISVRTMSVDTYARNLTLPGSILTPSAAARLKADCLITIKYRAPGSTGYAARSLKVGK